MDGQEIRAHYERGVELDRLATGPTSRVEFARTKELLERYLPPPPASILDVGGGPGVYAAWLAGSGYRVGLVDPVPMHIERARAAAAELANPFTVREGDARGLTEADGSHDAVLLLGPLYHLTDRTDRIAAIREATRVLRPGGVVAAAAISRFASLLDGLLHGYLGDPTFDRIVERDLREGQHRNPTDRVEWFTTAYFHHPDELRAELSEAGLEVEEVFGIEGPASLTLEILDDPERWDDVLRVARAVEREPTLLGVSDHLLAIGRKDETLSRTRL